MPRRPTFDEMWMEIAQQTAYRSRCARDQVGAVIVSPQNVILATGYNGPPAGFPSHAESCVDFCDRARNGPTTQTARAYTDCPSLHAEANALLHAPDDRRRGGTLYVTSEICFQCAKLIANSGIDRVVVRETGDVEHRAADASVSFLRDCHVRVDRV